MSALSVQAPICLQRVFSCKRHAPSNGQMTEPDNLTGWLMKQTGPSQAPCIGSHVRLTSQRCLSFMHTTNEGAVPFDSCALPLSKALRRQNTSYASFYVFSSLRNILALLHLRFPLMCNEVNDKKTSSDDTKFHKVVSKRTKTVKSV